MAISALQVNLKTECGNCFRCGGEFRRAGANKLCSGCRHGSGRRRPLAPALNLRETQVVALVSQAKLNKEIAYELHLTEGTIKEYLHRIFRKVGTSNRTELAVWALTHLPRHTDQHTG